MPDPAIEGAEKNQAPFRALNSASNLYRRKLCPGSANAERDIPPLADTAASRLGTFLHACEQEDNTDDLKAAQVRAIDKNKRLSDEFVQVQLARLGIENPGECIVFREKEFFLFADGGDEPVCPPFPGHMDEIRWYPEHKIVFVFDSKFGRYAVTRAEVNWQLRVYFVMVRDYVGGDKVFCAIRQPYLKSPNDFHATEYHKSDTDAARNEIIGILNASNEPDAKRIPSVDACMFCRALGTPKCPESMAFLTKVGHANIMNLSPSKLEAMADEIFLAKRIIDNWEERMKFIAERYPELLKEFALGRQGEVSHITSPYDALELLYNKSKLGDTFQGATTQFLSACEVSIPQLSVVVAAHLGIKEEDARTEVMMTLGNKRPGEDNPEALIETKPKARPLVRRK